MIIIITVLITMYLFVGIIAVNEWNKGRVEDKMPMIPIWLRIIGAIAWFPAIIVFAFAAMCYMVYACELRKFFKGESK
jgi:uncharacterized protein involved in cysteine biosynthesis